MKPLFTLLAIGSLLCSCLSGDHSQNNTESDSTQTEIGDAARNEKLWLGKWERRSWGKYASLEISNLRKDSFKFYFMALNGGHTGEHEGDAVFRGEQATFSSFDEYDTCILYFQLFGDSMIQVKQYKTIMSCGAGFSVYYDGFYVNAAIIPDTGEGETLISLGIFGNKEIDSTFRALVGESYELFLNSTQLITDDDDLDNFNAVVYSSGVPMLFTFMENIIMYNSDNKIWAAVIDDGEVHYFTNHRGHINRLPKTIDNWRQRFKNYPIVYK